MKEKTTQAISVFPLTGFDKVLGYKVPLTISNDIKIGQLVRVPLLSRTELAIVSDLVAPDDCPVNKLKFILQIVYPFSVLTFELIKLVVWMRSYYALTYDSVLEAIIPTAARKGMGLKSNLFIQIDNKLDAESLIQLQKKAPKQAKLYNFLSQQTNAVQKSKVLNRLGVNSSSCKTLIDKKIIKENLTQINRTVYDDEIGFSETTLPKKIILNQEQETAVMDIGESIDRHKFKSHLLHGVTGSGKTEVYIHLLKKVVAGGGGAILLVPEIALTPQTVGQVRSRLENECGSKIIVWHSMISEGEKLDAWHSLATGEANVVVGPRSAVFAPVQNLRLIIVDEEHEPAYKQDESPRYHGRDVAIYRARLNNAVCLLGSATPSLESLYNVEIGKYSINKILNRVDNRSLPLVHVVDMTREVINQKGHVVLSRMLIEKLKQRFEDKEQAILFINRRGYSSSMLCPDCSHIETCEHCSIAMTYHRTDEKLKCHICGKQNQAPKYCPKCQSEKIRWRGMGTQKVEDIVKKFLPTAKIVRLDSDSMQKKNLFRKIFSDFKIGKIDILVGTQMIAKGLDFPNVTLVGLIDADLSLHIQDFRASERTFQLLVQVAGRSGRGDQSGEVVAQSFLPYSAPIQFARRADFDGYFKEELEQRKSYNYPPFRHLIRHLFRGRNPDKVSFYAQQWVQHLENEMKKNAKLHPLEIRGPSPAPIEKMKDQYRFQVWYFVKNVSRIIPHLAEIRKNFKFDKDVIELLDIDPVNLS